MVIRAAGKVKAAHRETPAKCAGNGVPYKCKIRCCPPEVQGDRYECNAKANFNNKSTNHREGR
jgi:hypothetical protein